MEAGVKIVKAEYAGDYKIKITFSDKHVNTFNYNSMVTFDHEEFKQYRDISKFKRFKIEMAGYTIGWGKNWEMILHIETLYSQCRINPAWHFGKRAEKKLRRLMGNTKYNELNPKQ